MSGLVISHHPLHYVLSAFHTSLAISQFPDLGVRSSHPCLNHLFVTDQPLEATLQSESDSLLSVNTQLLHSRPQLK